MNLVCLVLSLALLAGIPASAKNRKTPLKGKAQVSAKRVSVNKSNSKKAHAKPTRAGSGKSVAAKRVPAPTLALARRTPRQSEPTAERYVEIQQALVDKGYHPGPVTGNWGPEWVAVLKQFQQEQSLSPDGKLGALSLIALGLGPKREPIAHVSSKPEVPR